MLLDSDAAATAAVGSLSALHPVSSSPPPADKPEWFLPGEPVTVAAAEQAAEV